jgi:phosphate transport system substrate-binding protein
MIATVKNEPGSIGYIGLEHAMQNEVRQASVLNSAGRFVKASRETITAACGAVEQGQWNNFSVSLTNPPGTDSFPITSFSWLYLPKANSDRASAVADLLNWLFTDGQQYVSEEGYVELPQPLLAAVRSRVKSLR